MTRTVPKRKVAHIYELFEGFNYISSQKNDPLMPTCFKQLYSGHPVFSFYIIQIQSLSQTPTPIQDKASQFNENLKFHRISIGSKIT